MFDTVRIKAENIVIHPDYIINQGNVQSTTYLDSLTGEIKTVAKIRNEKFPYIKYNDYAYYLELEVSIPKFLYGENITLLKQHDIELFFSLINKELKSMFAVDIDKSEWRVKRVDVCWNFDVGKLKQDYLKQLALMRMSRMNTAVYNQVETVIFQNKSKRIMFYDKAKECVVHRWSQDLVQQADGLLRMEISPARHEMKEFSQSNKAIDLLTKEFFIFITRRTTPYLVFPSMEEITYEWVATHPITKVETAIGFKKLYSLFGLGGVRELYKPNTFGNRKQLLKMFESKSILPPLKIDYSSI